MAITINPLTYVIYIPQDYLTYISGSLYELDVNQLRLDLKNLEDNSDGMSMPDTHSHATQVVLSGVTYARSLQIIAPYTVEFQDGQYTVRCIGANHNLADVKVANQVSLVIGNSSGLQVVSVGSGLSSEQDEKLTNVNTLLSTIEGSYDHAEAMKLILAVLVGKISGAPSGPIHIRDVNDTTDRVVATVDTNGNRTSVEVNTY